MPTHAEKRHLPYTPEQLFDLVADIERYPEFLPWCQSARIRKQEGNTVHADVVIGFKMFREHFSSIDVFDRPHRIDIRYTKGPLHYLNNHWVFEAAPDGGCVIDFYIDFEFRSRVFQKVIVVLFDEALGRLLEAFETRAHAIYGVPEAKAP